MTDKTNAGKPVDAKMDDPEQASTNFYWTRETTLGVFNFQTTIRGILTPEQIQAHLASAMSAAQGIMEYNGLAKDLQNKYSAPATKLPETPSTPLPSATAPENFPQPSNSLPTDVLPPTAPTPSEQAKEAPKEETFPTEKLAVTISNNKKYFKVKGGPWAKYGVTVWDEVLVRAGIPVQKLDAKEYDLPGYIATFIRKADGKPDKVIKLEKVA